MASELRKAWWGLVWWLLQSACMVWYVAAIVTPVMALHGMLWLAVLIWVVFAACIVAVLVMKFSIIRLTREKLRWQEINRQARVRNDQLQAVLKELRSIR